MVFIVVSSWKSKTIRFYTVFIVFDSLGIKNHTFSHGVHGFSFPDLKNHTFLHGFHGFSFIEHKQSYAFTWFSWFLIPWESKTIRFYMVFMVFLFLITKNHTFLHGFHGFLILADQNPYVSTWFS